MPRYSQSAKVAWHFPPKSFMSPLTAIRRFISSRSSKSSKSKSPNQSPPPSQSPKTTEPQTESQATGKTTESSQPLPKDSVSEPEPAKTLDSKVTKTTLASTRRLPTMAALPKDFTWGFATASYVATKPCLLEPPNRKHQCSRSC